MLKRNHLLFLSFLLVTMVVMPTLAQATDLPRIFIVGEDADRDTVPRKSRVFKRVLNSISNSLLDQGFDVKDETALTSDTHIQGKSRRTDAELIGIAKDAGIDVLVIFSIYPAIKKQHSNSVKVWSRVEGRILSVYDGSRLGNFEVEPQKWVNVKKPYSRNDILEAVGKLSKVMGTEVGDVLAARLNQYHGGSADGSSTGGTQIAREWKFIFDGFSDDDMMDIEEYLVKFSGYSSHRPDPAGLNTSKHHEMLYKSSIDSAKLKRNFHKMYKLLKMQVRTYISGLEVKMKKLATVKQRKKNSDSDW